jgi:hypothetical protein
MPYSQVTAKRYGAANRPVPKLRRFVFDIDEIIVS